jgi:hypothetical protein
MVQTCPGEFAIVMPNPKDKQFAEKDNKDLVLARDFGDDCLQYTTDLTESLGASGFRKTIH